MTNAKTAKSSVSAQLVAAAKTTKPVAKPAVKKTAPVAKTTKPVTVAQAAKMLTEKAQRGDKIAAAKSNVPSVKKPAVKVTSVKKPAVKTTQSAAALRRSAQAVTQVIKISDAVKVLLVLMKQHSKGADVEKLARTAAWDAMISAQKVFELVGK